MDGLPDVAWFAPHPHRLFRAVLASSSIIGRMNGGRLSSLLAGVIATSLLAAGCGGSPSVASLGTTSTTSTTPATAPAGSSFAPFADCMTTHGVPTFVGQGGHGVAIQGIPNAAQMQAAQTACRKLMPGGGPPELTPAQEAERAKGLATFSRCMRKHRVGNFPDPTGQGELPIDAISQLDTQTPLFQNAYKACHALFPRLGPQIRF